MALGGLFTLFPLFCPSDMLFTLKKEADVGYSARPLRVTRHVIFCAILQLIEIKTQGAYNNAYCLMA